MKKLKSFSKFFESSVELPQTRCKASNLNGIVTIFRLTSHPVVDLKSPGEYYVCDKSKLDPSMLNNSESVSKDDIHIITVECDSSNIDVSKSELECSKMRNDSIVVVKDDSICEVISVVPYQIITN